MQLNMEDKNLRTIEQVKQFLEGNQALEFTAPSMDEKYEWIGEVLGDSNMRRKQGKV